MADDQQLWEQICRGDAEAFNGFYRSYAPRLQAFLRQLVGNSQTAEDLMQETFTQSGGPDAGNVHANLAKA